MIGHVHLLVLYKHKLCIHRTHLWLIFYVHLIHVHKILLNYVFWLESINLVFLHYYQQLLMYIYSTAQFKLYICVSVYTYVCMFTICVAKNIGVHVHCCMQFCLCMFANEHTQHTSGIHHEFALDLPHYMFSVQVR